SRYSGVASTNPVGNVISGNTTGANGSCSGGLDNNSYAFNLTTSVAGAMAYGAAAMRQRTHTPGAGYSERGEIIQVGTGAGSAASVAVEDKSVASPSTVIVNGTISGSVDWAVVALEIKPEPGIGVTILDDLSISSSSSVLVKQAEEAGIEQTVPAAFMLSRNYPNPFHFNTQIQMALPEEGQVHAVILDVNGREVRQLYQDQMPSGYRSINWDGTNTAGQHVSSGVYFLRVIFNAPQGQKGTLTRQLQLTR
ncbi:MAG: FlgD immunoglobulin-like domain containing protein, partial [bacterium]